jgi:hypothetical protein
MRFDAIALSLATAALVALGPGHATAQGLPPARDVPYLSRRCCTTLPMCRCLERGATLRLGQTFLRARLDAVASDAAFDGLARAGWRLTFTGKQSEYAKTAEAYRESFDFSHSLGFIVGKEGKLLEVLWDGRRFVPD